jgi:hypothetical protein
MMASKRPIIVASIVLPLLMWACAGMVGGGDAVSDRLFFGRSIPAGGMVSDSAWDAFLAEVVTPRFPAGLTVWRAEGQWRGPDGRLDREPVMVVEVLHPRGTPADSVFESIANIYCRRFGQDAVLRSTASARMKLYDDLLPER